MVMAATGSTSVLALLLIVGSLRSALAGQTWTVGESLGWTTSPNVSYDQWASGKSIHVGDNLLFSYTAGEHNVLEVTQQDLAGCVATKPISSNTASPAIIQITRSGYHGYISGLASDCANGMHLNVQVSTGPAGTPIGTPAAAPTSPEMPGSPGSSPVGSGPSARPSPAAPTPSRPSKYPPSAAPGSPVNVSSPVQSISAPGAAPGSPVNVSSPAQSQSPSVAGAAPGTAVNGPTPASSPSASTPTPTPTPPSQSSPAKAPTPSSGSQPSHSPSPVPHSPSPAGLPGGESPGSLSPGALAPGPSEARGESSASNLRTTPAILIIIAAALLAHLL